jgi:hypothetical protein
MLPKGASRLQKGALRVTKRSIIGYKKEHRLQKGAGVLYSQKQNGGRS